MSRAAVEGRGILVPSSHMRLGLPKALADPSRPNRRSAAHSLDAAIARTGALLQKEYTLERLAVLVHAVLEQHRE